MFKRYLSSDMLYISAIKIAFVDNVENMNMIIAKNMQWYYLSQSTVITTNLFLRQVLL